MESTNVTSEYITLEYHEQTKQAGARLLTLVKGRLSGYAGERAFYFTAPDCQQLLDAEYTFTGLDKTTVFLLTSLPA